MFDILEKRFAQVIPAADFCSLRYVSEQDEVLSVRQDIPQPAYRATDAGVMITVMHSGGLGYGATSDLSVSGLRAAVEQAVYWAGQTAGRSVADFSKIVMPCPIGQYIGAEKVPWESVSLADKFEILSKESARLKTDDRIVDWEASLWRIACHTLYLTSAGGKVIQNRNFLAPSLSVTANRGAVTQRRSLGGRGYCRQGGMEILRDVGFHTAGPGLAAEALELLAAGECPIGKMDLLIAPDQMILQIHESVGHPLELDRILGDERNFAGVSFVQPAMIGKYQYGSELLNITFDPTRPQQLASYGFDDDGLAAHKEFIIEKGILKRALGGTISQARAPGIAGVANSRASSWNRPPIDRMANLNLEPGASTLDEMIASIRRGVYVKTNCSWSIDDSRNKFQFGCEWGRLIEDGRLTSVVRNPNYRGISATFWRNLRMVGDASTFEVLGTPNCGKGEPNQVIRVGHASPACVFAGVDVFGGA